MRGTSQTTTPQEPAIREEEGKIKLNTRMFASGFCMALIFQPFEVVRTTLIMNKDLRHLREALQFIYRKEGPSGFLKGAQMSVIRSSINFNF